MVMIEMALELEIALNVRMCISLLLLLIRAGLNGFPLQLLAPEKLEQFSPRSFLFDGTEERPH